MLVELRDYSLSRDRYETLADYLSFRARSDGLGVSGDLLDGHLRAGGRVLLLLDGLDELFDPREREAVSRQIAGFAAAYPSARVLVTSRVVGYRPRILREAGFRHYTIQDLDPKQIDGFLETWYRLALHDRSAVAAGRRERLAKAIRDSPSIRELAGNPLLLTILAIIGKHQELPRERWKVYDHAASVLVQHWDVNKHLQDARVDAAVIREEDKKELLRRLAYRMQTGAQGLAGNHLWHDELASEIEDYLRVRFQYEPAQAAAIANSMIDQFRERNFVLARYGSKIYGFVHRGLLEFFCASEIVARFEKTRALSEAELITRVYGEHWEDQAWTEVLRLIAGMVDVSVADRIIASMVTEARPVRSPVLDRLPLDVVALAVQCLVEIRNISAAAHSAGCTLRALIETLRRPNRSFAEDRDQRLEKVILPAVTAIGARWPGREDYLVWFDSYGGRTAVLPAAQYAARFAAALFPDSDRMREGLVERARTHPIAGQRRAAMLGLVEVWPESAATRELVLRVARDPVHEVRLAAVEALCAHWASHPSASAALSAAVRDYSPEVRKSALVALSSHWTAKPSTYPVVREALLDHDEDVREAALRALVVRWAEHADTLPAVHRVLRRDPHWDVRQVALEVLVDGWADDPETLSLVQCAAVEVDEDVREAALDALVARWADHPATLPAVQRALRDVDEDVRAAAVELLAARWPEHPDTRALLGRAGRDVEGVVRSVALSALASLYGAADGLHASLRRAAQDAEAGVRSAAVRRLAADWSQDPETLAIVMRATRDPDPGVRTKALAALVDYWPDHDETYRAALSGVDDPDVESRKVALQTLARLHADRPEVRRVFQEAVRDRDWGVRRIGLEALSALQEGNGGGEIRWLVRRVTEDSSGLVRQIALETLIADPQWTDGRAEVLEAALRDPHAGTSRAAYLATVTERFGPQVSREDLLAAAGSAFWFEREAALFQLVVRDPDEPAVWDRVLRATTDPDQPVRRMAFDLAVMLRGDMELGRRIVASATRDPDSGVRWAALTSTIVAAPAAIHDSGLLQRALTDPHDPIRWLGFATQLLHRPDDEQTFAMLAQASIDTSQWKVRLSAQQTLAEHWCDDARTLTEFWRIARAGPRDARRIAIRMLCIKWTQHPETLRLVQAAVEDQWPSTRKRATDHLVVLWPHHEATRELIGHATWDPDHSVGRYARQALAALGGLKRPDTIAESCRLARDCNPPARMAGLETLLIRWPEAVQTREAVRTALNDEIWSIQKLAGDAIRLGWADDIEGGASAVAAQALEHPQTATRYLGIHILARITGQQDGTRALLMDVLSDPTAYIRNAAAEVLFTAWPDEPQTRVAALRLMEDLDDDVRMSALQYLVEHRSQSQTAKRDAWISASRAVTDPAATARRYAIEALAAYWPGEPDTLAALDQARGDPSRSVRELGWRSTQLQPRRVEEFQTLVRDVASAERTVRWDAVEQLTERWSDIPDVHALVMGVTSDPASEVRDLALSALAERWPDHVDTYQIVVAATGDSSRDIRTTAVRLLADRWPEAETTRDTIIALCADPISSVRAAAIAAYCRCCFERAEPNPGLLIDSLHDPHWWVRYNAAQTAVLWRCISSNNLLWLGCDSALTNRELLGATMARYAADLPADLRTLLGFYSGADQAMAAKAAHVLVSRWGDCAEVLPVLREEAARSKSHALRIKSLTALVTKLGACAESRELLERGLASDCPGVRESALNTLALPTFGGLAVSVIEAALDDDDLVVRWTARDVPGPRGREDGLLANLVDGPVLTADPILEQFQVIKELALRGRDEPEFPDLLRQVASNTSVSGDERQWLDWLCERLGT